MRKPSKMMPPFLSTRISERPDLICNPSGMTRMMPSRRSTSFHRMCTSLVSRSTSDSRLGRRPAWRSAWRMASTTSLPMALLPNILATGLMHAVVQFTQAAVAASTIVESAPSGSHAIRRAPPPEVHIRTNGAGGGRCSNLGRPAVDEQDAGEREHQLAGLVRAGIAGEHEALVGPALHRPRLDHLAGERDGVAGIDRPDPLELAEARRRAGAADRLAPRAHRFFLAHPVLHDQADAHRAGMPAGRDQAAEVRARRRHLVEMERLRIEGLGKCLDLFCRERVAAERGLVADADVFEELHAGSTRTASRVGNRA